MQKVRNDKPVLEIHCRTYFTNFIKSVVIEACSVSAKIDRNGKGLLIFLVSLFLSFSLSVSLSPSFCLLVCKRPEILPVLALQNLKGMWSFQRLALSQLDYHMEKS